MKLLKTRNYKIERYNKLQILCVNKNFRVTNLYAEFSSLEVLPKTSKNLKISAK